MVARLSAYQHRSASAGQRAQARVVSVNGRTRLRALCVRRKQEVLAAGIDVESRSVLRRLGISKDKRDAVAGCVALDKEYSVSIARAVHRDEATFGIAEAPNTISERGD